MKVRFIVFLILTLIAVAACDSLPPEKIIEVEVTRVVVVTATEEPESGPIVTVAAQGAEKTVEPTNTPTPVEATATPDVFPTPIVGQIFVAEQEFQNAKMLWLQPINQIWILQSNNDGENIWTVREDTWAEGLPENDPELTPPAEGLIQPVRGFGLLWRSDDALRSQIGWATDEELGYTTDYEYHWGGTVNEDNEYVTGPGYHLLKMFSQDVYRFDEETRTWSILGEESSETPEATESGG